MIYKCGVSVFAYAYVCVGKGAVPSSERQAKMARIEREAVLHEVKNQISVYIMRF